MTNIYEKLFLDMCGELFTDLRALTPDVSFHTVRRDKRPLAFFNPPNALACLHPHMKRKVKQILNEETLAQQQQQNLQHCPMPYLGMAFQESVGPSGSGTKWTKFPPRKCATKSRAGPNLTAK